MPKTRASLRRTRVLLATLATVAMVVTGGLAPELLTVAASAPKTPTNYVSNPDIESFTKGAPTGWKDATYGNNTHTATVVTPGHGGTGHALRQDITAYTDGQAYWNSAAFNVTPGQTFDASIWYQSNVNTDINVKLTKSDGTAYYWFVTRLGPATDWTQAKGTFVVPANVVNVKIYQFLQNVGYLVTDDYSVTTGPAYAQPMVSVTMDDAWASQYTAAAPILSANQIPATFYVPSGELNTNGYMTKTQVQQLYAQGNQIAAHTVTHPDLTTVTASQLDYQLKQSQIDLQNLTGAPVLDFAYPFGKFNPTVEAACLTYYRSCRNTEYGLSTPDQNRGELVVQYIKSTTTLAEFQSWVSWAQASNTWLILVYHAVIPNPTDIYNTTPQAFSDQMSYLHSTGIATPTVSAALATGASTPDTVAPTATITSPTTGSTLNPGSISVAATASDDRGVSSVDLQVDGVTVGTDTQTPYTFTWNASLGSHTLVAVAHDAAGNAGGSPPVTVQIADVSPPTAPPALSASNVSSQSASLSWSAASDNVGVTGYQVVSNGTVLPGLFTSLSYTDTGLRPGTSYTYTVRGVDGAGNVGPDSPPVTVTTTASSSASTVFSNHPLASWRLDGVGNTTLQVGNTVYVGGTFTQATSPDGSRVVPRANLAAFDATTGALIQTFQADTDAEVRALAFDGTRLYVGGSFTTVNGVTRVGLAALDPATGVVISSWSADTSADVYGLAVANRTLYLSGSFVTVRGVARSRIASLNLTDNSLTSFAPSANGTVNTIAAAPDGSAVYVGGDYTAINGTPTLYMTELGPDGSVVLPSFATVNGPALALDVSADGTTVAAGLGGEVGDQSGHDQGALFDTTTGAKLWAQICGHDGQAIRFVAGSVYTGYHGGCGTDTTIRLTRNDPTTGSRDLTFIPSFDQFWGVWGISGSSSALVVAGDFTTISGVSVKGFAIFPPRDNTAPTAPPALTAGPPTSQSVQLSWSAATDNVGVTGYQVVRNGTVLPGTVSLLTYTDTGLTPATTYTYTVRAMDADGNIGPDSAPVTITTAPGPDTTAPTPPPSLTAGNATTTTVDLSWAAATDNVGVTGYQVVRNGKVLPGLVSGLSFTDTGLFPAATYTYTVRAVDAAGNVSTDSPPATITTAPDTSAPTAPPNLTAGNATLSTVDLAWGAATDNVAVTAYQIVRNGTVLPSNVTGLSFTDTGLSPGTSYTYTVRAVDAAGNVSNDSPPATITTAADTSAPTAPPTLTAGNATSSTVDLSWGAATDNVAVTGYRVVRNGTLLPGTVTGLSFTDTGLAPSTSYTYTVRAVDAAGNVSSDSPSATGTTTAAPDTTAPSAPPSLTAGNASSSTIDLSWGAATDNVAVTGYRVVRNGVVLPSIVTGLSFTDTGLAPSTSYTYTVRAVDAAGNVSPDSPSATGTTTAAPDTTAPSAPPNLTAGNATLSTVDLAWGAASDNVGVTGYQVVRNGTVLPGTVSGLSFTDTGLSPGTTYTYTVRAMDAAGNVSADSSPASITTATPPDTTAPTPPPTLTTGTVTSQSVQLSWGAATDNVAVTGYQVVRNGTVLPGTVSGLSFTDTGLSPSTTYTYTVRAVDAAGNVSTDSPAATATTSAPPDTTPPSAPPALTLGATTAQSAQLSWGAATDNVGVTGYQVVRNGTVLPGIATGLTYTDSGLIGGATYTYTVRAVDAAGNVSPDSTSVTATLPFYVDGWSGSNGSPWASAWTVTQTSGTVDTQNGLGRMLFSDVSGAYARAQLTGVAAQTNTDLLTSFQWTSTGATGYFGVYLRGSGGWQNTYRPKTGYGIELSSSSGSVTVLRNVNGVLTTLQTVSGGQTVTTATQWLRLRVSGSTIQFRTWLDGQAEPTTWKTTITDTGITSAGQLHLALNRGSTNVGSKGVLLDNLRLSPTGP